MVVVLFFCAVTWYMSTHANDLGIAGRVVHDCSEPFCCGMVNKRWLPGTSGPFVRPPSDPFRTSLRPHD